MKIFTMIALLTLYLLAQEETVTKKIEGGLIHTKQEGRYSVVLELPEKADGFEQAFDFSSLGADRLNLEFVYGHFLLENSPAEVEESDVVLTYAITDRWYLESIYSDINMINIDYSNPENQGCRDFRRLVTRLDYSF